MNKQLFPTALRELRSDFTNRNVLVGLAGAGVILGLSGPFDTLRMMSVVPRLLYWTAVVFLTFGVGSFISSIIRQWTAARPAWVHVALSACAVGTAVTCVLAVMNAVAFGIIPDTLQSWAAQWGIVTLISAVIEISAKLMRTEDASAAPPPLLDRLPYAKRGPLVALSAQDHYVQVQTTKGTEMLLMRLSDAIKEVGPTKGLQIHRSHWVATDQIADVRRVNDRGELTLTTGDTRPISRGYMAAVREAGLLPRGRNG